MNGPGPDAARTGIAAAVSTIDKAKTRNFLILSPQTKCP
jgi:hypothetical protein